MNKKELRMLMKEKRKTLEISNKKLVEKIRQTDEYKSAKHIMLFYPMKYEVNLLDLIQDSSKYFYLPKIKNKDLLCCPYQDGDELCLSEFKTLEPMTEPCDKNQIDLVIVPALCCDKNNCRLGYGGGFYDRFLCDFKGKTITCLPKELITDTVYPEPYDIPIDLVITC